MKSRRISCGSGDELAIVRVAVAGLAGGQDGQERVGEERGEGGDQRVRDAGRAACPCGKGTRTGVAGLAFHQCRDRRSLPGGDDEISFPVPGLLAETGRV